MENIINTTDLKALATDVISKLTTIHDDLDDLFTLSGSLYAALSDEYRNHKYGSGRPYCAISGDYWLAKEIADAVSSVRNKIIDTHWKSSGSIYSIAEKVADRDDQYSRVEEELAREARAAKVAAENEARLKNQEAGIEAERIVSDFLKISGQTGSRGRGRFKEFYATVVFLFNGNVFEAETRFDKDTREFNGQDAKKDAIGYTLKDRRTMKGSYLFKPEMTDEEIGKAAHALDCIRAALREQAGPLAKAQDIAA